MRSNSPVALQKLYRYISGNNADNAKISMTTPVITFVKPSEDFKTAEKNYTVAFYLPQQFQVSHCTAQQVFLHHVWPSAL